MHRPLENHVAWVTGSSTGLGKAIAVALGDAGAQVAFNYQRNRSRAEATFAAYEATGAKGLLVRGDVTDPDEVNRMQREIAEKLGPVDILVPNATPDQPQRPIEEYDWAFYQTMLDYFVKSPFLLARACLPEMKRRKWGRIVNIGSEAFQRGVGNFSAYVAAKGGQTGWTRSLATELAPFGITVNLVAPGWIPVERHENDPPEMKAAYLGAIPAKRWGTPADVAAAVVYLASDGAAFVTGQTLAVNGGLTVS
jgi:3-oxoacyl-[acyl-carrier protein] reductase